MPHRLFTEFPSVAYIVEAIMLGTLAGFKVSESAILAITEQDWSRLLGPQGFTVGLVLAVIVLWGNGMVREKNERERREKEEEGRDKRHNESISLQRENSEKLINLTVESIRAKGMMAMALEKLTRELEGRPCNANKPLPSFNFDHPRVTNEEKDHEGKSS